MTVVRSRFAPALLFVAGILVAVLVPVLSGPRPYDGLNHYDPIETFAFLAYAAAALGTNALTALRTRDRVVRVVGWSGVALWVPIVLALYFDVMWALVGPGVAPMTDTCLGGMDCIGEPVPGAPLLGSADMAALLCLLSVPFVALVALMGAFPGDSTVKASGDGTA